MPEVIDSGEDQVLRALLREYRRAAALTQAEVATRLNRPQSYVSKYESGERQLGVLEIRRVCRELGVSLETLAADLETRLERQSAG